MSWFWSAIPSLFSSTNQQGLPKMRKNSSGSSDGDDYYFNFYPLSSVPFVYHEIESRSELKPRARSGHRIITDSNGNIYCLGGYNPEGFRREDDTRALFKELWKFNMSSLVWSKVPMSGDPPQLLCSFGAVCIDDMLFVQGGTGVPFGSRGCNQLYVCQLSTGVWRKYRLKVDNNNIDIPPKFYGQALTFDPEKKAIYSVGGTCGHIYHTGVTKINLHNGSAQLIYTYNSFESNVSYRHEIALHNNRIYQFGGGTQDDDIGFDQLFYFDLKRGFWDTVETFPDPVHGHPTARKFHGLVTLDDCVFIVGGGSCIPSRNGPVGRDDVWKFNLETLEWTLVCKLPKAVYFHSVSLSSTGLLTIFGGVQSIDSRQTQRTNEMGTIWLKVPSLGEIAWITFLNNCVDVTKISEPQLLDIGVPRSYVNRLIS